MPTPLECIENVHTLFEFVSGIQREITPGIKWKCNVCFQRLFVKMAGDLPRDWIPNGSTENRLIVCG